MDQDLDVMWNANQLVVKSVKVVELKQLWDLAFYHHSQVHVVEYPLDVDHVWVNVQMEKDLPQDKDIVEETLEDIIG